MCALQSPLLPLYVTCTVHDTSGNNWPSHNCNVTIYTDHPLRRHKYKMWYSKLRYTHLGNNHITISGLFPCGVKL